MTDNRNLKITILSGGTGSVKLIRGLSKIFSGSITIIGNVGDNITLFGLYICPDLDTVMYCLAGMLDEARGWGVKDDSFDFLSQLRRLGQESWFSIGDRDLATHLVRTSLLKDGMKLSEVTGKLCRSLGLKAKLLPATDDFLETHVLTRAGEEHLQEFWVKGKGLQMVKGIKYVGSESAKAAPGVVESLGESDLIVIPPANPVSSIGPIIAVEDIREALRNAKACRLVVSPVVGNQPISGPAAKMMTSLGIEVSPKGVADMYKDLVDFLIIDSSDRQLLGSLGPMKVLAGDTIMKTYKEEDDLARFVLNVYTRRWKARLEQSSQ